MKRQGLTVCPMPYMTENEYKAAKHSFKQVPESCPLVDAKFDLFLKRFPINDPAALGEFERCREFAKECNTTLRTLSLKLGAQLIDAGLTPQ